MISPTLCTAMWSSCRQRWSVLESSLRCNSLPSFPPTLSLSQRFKLALQDNTVLQACVDLKLGSSLLDFECHFNEVIEKKMR
ncbi:hypothetical protein ACSBR1_033557 [Camellia fascicularis]